MFGHRPVLGPGVLDSRRAGFCCGLLLLSLASGCGGPRGDRLALRRVVLYRNGIGHFERSGHFERRTFHLRLRAHEVDDVLKTLAVLDGESGHPLRAQASLNDKKLGDRPATDAKEQAVQLNVGLGHPQPRKVTFSYAVPTPVWKASYRLLLPGRQQKGGTQLQGWATINNASGEDWKGVKLTLATSAPFSFIVDMHTPHFVSRPDLGHRLDVPAVTGATFAERAGPSDRDGDGVPDRADRCPEVAEDRDGFEDRDGCPELDNDQDQVVDAQDKCPDEPETFNGYEDEDGCPDKGRVVVHRGRIEILDKVYFAHNSALIRDAAHPILDAIAASLRGNPQIQLAEIQGHASAEEAAAHGLAARRAAAVRSYLVAKGVAGGRLKDRSYGSTRPVRPDGSGENASFNRRVEFLILRREDGDDPASSDEEAPTSEAETETAQRSTVVTTDIAGVVHYVLSDPVTIPQGSTTIVSIINQRIEGEEVYLYRHDPNVPHSARHPQRAVRLVNDHHFTLEPGPVAISAAGAFVGEGLIGRLHRDEEAFIPFSLDGSSSVRVESNEGDEPFCLVAVVNGVATVESHQVQRTRYEIAVGAEAPATIFIKHPRRSGYEVRHVPPGTRVEAEALLIPLAISPSRTQRLEVEEWRPRWRSIQVFDEQDGSRLELYLEGSNLPQEVARELRQVIALRQQVSELEHDLEQLRQQLQETASRSNELRESLRAIEKLSSATGLRQRLLSRLKAAVEESERLSQGLSSKTALLTEARANLRAALQTLRITSAEQVPGAAK